MHPDFSIIQSVDCFNIYLLKLAVKRWQSVARCWERVFSSPHMRIPGGPKESAASNVNGQWQILGEALQSTIQESLREVSAEINVQYANLLDVFKS